VHHLLAARQSRGLLARLPVERDFVEAPPQVFEQWAWDPDTLASFATDSTGMAIPRETVRRMSAAREVLGDVRTRGRLFYAVLAYRLHRTAPATREELRALVADTAAEYEPLGFASDTHVHASFLHLLAYGPATYTYLWGEVLARRIAQVVSPSASTEGAHRFRTSVFERGAAAPARDLIGDLLGHESADVSALFESSVPVGAGAWGARR
jgi:thimet oligopeptidase